MQYDGDHQNYSIAFTHSLPICHFLSNLISILSSLFKKSFSFQMIKDNNLLRLNIFSNAIKKIDQLFPFCIKTQVLEVEQHSATRNISCASENNLTILESSVTLIHNLQPKIPLSKSQQIEINKVIHKFEQGWVIARRKKY